VHFIVVQRVLHTDLTDICSVSILQAPLCYGYFSSRDIILSTLTVRLIGQVVWRKFTNNSKDVTIPTFKANRFP